MQGCPFECVFCNQHNITGQHNEMSDDEIVAKIESHLSTFPDNDNIVEIGFFGGSFTGLPIEVQQHYLKLVQPWIDSHRVGGIRISTRPDYINDEILSMLKNDGVKTIELGVQSMSDIVLRKSGRGHNADDVRKAAAMIKSYAFSLGMQMMIGLPGDTLIQSLQTAEEIIRLGAESTRIYPALVIRNTSLETLYRQGRFEPLPLDEAIDWCSRIVPLFEKAGVKILRLGLHASEGILHGNELVAGPFHVAFGEMVFSKIWNNILIHLQPGSNAQLTILVPPAQLNYAIGHQGMNRKMMEQNFNIVKFKSDERLKDREFKFYFEH